MNATMNNGLYEAADHIRIAATLLDTWYHVGVIEDIADDLRHLADAVERHIR